MLMAGARQPDLGQQIFDYLGQDFSGLAGITALRFDPPSAKALFRAR